MNIDDIEAKKINVADIVGAPILTSKQTITKFRADGYGGIETVELNYPNDCVYIRGDLADDYEDIEEFLEYNRRKLYDSIVECAESIKE